MSEPIFTPADFVAVTNQIFERTMPQVTIEGELANFRVSKNKWVYFDLKDEYASVKFFGSVYMLPGPLEEGMRLRVTGRPQLHPLYGFSLTVQTIALSGEGTIKKAFDLLFATLQAEGLFDESRKRPLPYPPRQIGLITSGESAAYADFIKILNERWSGVEILHADTQVQGDAAVAQIVAALEWFNAQAELPDVLVLTRGGGSADDLAVFNTEQVTRAIAASRVPTLVAIGHEVDTSLAELAADQRASTPSNAAQLLVPDKRHEIATIRAAAGDLRHSLLRIIENHRRSIADFRTLLLRHTESSMYVARRTLEDRRRVLVLYDPRAVLKRGYALVRQNNSLLRSIQGAMPGQRLEISLHDGDIGAAIEEVRAFH